MKTEVRAEPNDFEARPDRVRAHSNGLQNKRIDAQTQQCLERYAPAHREATSRHIDALDREWDVERYLERSRPAAIRAAPPAVELQQKIPSARCG